MRQPFPIYVPNRRIPNAENWNSGEQCYVLSVAGSLWRIIQMMFWTWATAFVSQIDPSPLLYTLAGSCRSSRVFKCMHVSLFAIQRCLCKWKRVRRKIIYLKQLKLLFLILAKLWYCSTPLVRYMMGNKWPVLLSGKQSSSLLFLVTDAEIYLMKVDQLL